MLEENSLLFFCKKHASKGALCLLILIVGSFFLGKGVTSRNSHEREDCIRIGKLFSEMQMGHDLTKESLDEMNEIVTRHPFLAPKYEQLISLALLAQQQEDKALLHIATAVERHKNVETPLAQFNEITLLIEKKEYEKAMQESKELNLRLEQESRYPTLYACSLLRMLFLARQQSDPLLTKVTWDKLTGHPSWPQLAPFFYDNDFALQDYVMDSILIF